MVVLKDGKAIYKNYFGDCTRESCIHVFSVTKSIVSILFGIALDKGYLDNIDRKVLEFFPEYTVKRGEKTIQHITIRDMLTMTAPYKYKSNLLARTGGSSRLCKREPVYPARNCREAEYHVP